MKILWSVQLCALGELPEEIHRWTRANTEIIQYDSRQYIELRLRVPLIIKGPCRKNRCASPEEIEEVFWILVTKKYPNHSLPFRSLNIRGQRQMIRVLYNKPSLWPGRMWWRCRDLNPGHCGYEPHALTDWATSPCVEGISYTLNDAVFQQQNYHVNT